MAKEFDIYLNNRLTQCDIIVYSIPYRDGLTVMNRIILESCLDNYLLQKFVAAQTSSELVAHIDEMIKICREKLSVGMAIGADVEMSVHYALSPEDAAIVLGQNNVSLTASSFIATENAVVLDVEPLLALVGKSLGGGESSILFDQSVYKEIKNSIERYEDGIGVSAQVTGTAKRGSISVESAVVPMADVTDLCYRLHCAGETALALAASVLGTEIHFSLGSGSSGIVLGAEVDGDRVTKFETAQNTLMLLAELTDQLTQFMEPEPTAVELFADMQPIVKRHRLLGEMDESTLVSFDEMTLAELDYIILEP